MSGTEETEHRNADAGQAPTEKGLVRDRLAALIDTAGASARAAIADMRKWADGAPAKGKAMLSETGSTMRRWGREASRQAVFAKDHAGEWVSGVASAVSHATHGEPERISHLVRSRWDRWCDLWGSTQTWARVACVATLSLSMAAAVASLVPGGVEISNLMMASGSASMAKSVASSLDADEHDAILAASQQANASMSGFAWPQSAGNSGYGGGAGSAEDDIADVSGARPGKPISDGIGTDGHAMPSVWVESPSLGVSLPVWLDGDGMGDASDTSHSLSHVSWTSLPVGGKGTICAMSDGSGFLLGLARGDIIVVWSLGDAYAYRVTSARDAKQDTISSMLHPEDASDRIAIISGMGQSQDGNGHVAFAERVPYSEATKMQARDDASFHGIGPLEIATVIFSLASAPVAAWLIAEAGVENRARQSR